MKVGGPRTTTSERVVGQQFLLLMFCMEFIKWIHIEFKW